MHKYNKKSHKHNSKIIKRNNKHNATFEYKIFNLTVINKNKEFMNYKENISKPK